MAPESPDAPTDTPVVPEGSDAPTDTPVVPEGVEPTDAADGPGAAGWLQQSRNEPERGVPLSPERLDRALKRLQSEIRATEDDASR